MKNMFKFFGIVTLTVIIGFSLSACYISNNDRTDLNNSENTFKKFIAVPGIPSAYKGKYASLYLTSLSDRNYAAYCSTAITGASTTFPLSDWETDTPWNGIGNYIIEIIISEDESMAYSLYYGTTALTAVTVTTTVIEWDSFNSAGNIPAKSVTIKNIPSAYNGKYASLLLKSSLNDRNYAAHCIKTISGASTTFFLLDFSTENPWNGSGNYIINILISENALSISDPLYIGNTASTVSIPAAQINVNLTWLQFKSNAPADTTPIPLTVGAWSAEGNIAGAYSETWYTFKVTSGTTYYVWVKDNDSPSVVGGSGYADIMLDARYGSKTGTVIFEESDDGSGIFTSESFIASQSGTVYLRVCPYLGLDYYGAYKVAVTTANKRPDGE
ncbi:hypothetical protein R84B8_01901 [Treponema sp. R8-4-B8]